MQFSGYRRTLFAPIMLLRRIIARIINRAIIFDYVLLKFNIERTTVY